MTLAHHNQISFWLQSIFHIKTTVHHATFTHLCALFTHFLILASFQIMNFQYVFALFFFHIPKNEHFFLVIVLKSTIGYEKICFIWPLNRFLLGRLINNRTANWMWETEMGTNTEEHRSQNDRFFHKFFLFTLRHIIRYVTTHRKGYDYCESERIHITPTTTQTMIKNWYSRHRTWIKKT